MSYCLGPTCRRPQNPSAARFCQSCGAGLLLCDRYRAIRPIGQGGFGKTFLAIDEHLPSKPHCVVKQLFLHLGEPYQTQKAIELFQHEALQLNQLGQHPQIPRLLAHFTHQSHHYLVQTYVDGQNLAQLARMGTFNESQIRQALVDLLPVLTFIHSNQVIHRDIKPANIIRRQRDGQLVLVDFGACKLATSSAYAQTGTVIGSAGYAAPEQVGGKAVFASDLYSLGVTCIHLLTNVPPFDLFSFSEGAWVWRDYLATPVSEALGRVLDGMIEPAINQRYASAAIALQALNPSPVVIPTSTSAALLPVPVPLASGWQCLHTLKEHSNSVATVAISPSGRLLASGSFDKTIKLWHLGTGALVSTLSGHLKPVLSVAFSPNGQTLIAGSVDNTLRLWCLHTESPLYAIEDHATSLVTLAVAVSPDGQAIACGSDDQTVKILHLYTGRLFRTLRHPRSVTSVAISPDGRVLASGSNDNTIRLWDFSTGELHHTLVAHARDVNSVAISPNSQLLASGGSDNTIRLWNIATGKLLDTITGHLDWVTAVAFSPDGQTLASGSDDCTVRLWNLTTRKRAHLLSGHTNGVTAIAFHPDSQTLVSGSRDRTVKIWRYC
ncbi:serine/threonine protein kinase [Oculatella sp. LEGE 06141]|uniref:serine/threonine-protein kinase n=1 Tax=Oculatella sp. LEGE 06141 TaxID=1828648 RepID=UPI00187F63EC|nr:serine/threonine-protein kinase [Oculatella sp. LEGE 06141]MBE9182120.1 serine/threonine protein kinase [Oculatella sp. LEGE 06141]